MQTGAGTHFEVRIRHQCDVLGDVGQAVPKDEKAEPLFWVWSLPTTGRDEFNMKAWGFHQDGSLSQEQGCWNALSLPPTRLARVYQRTWNDKSDGMLFSCWVSCHFDLVYTSSWDTGKV